MSGESRSASASAASLYPTRPACSSAARPASSSARRPASAPDGPGRLAATHWMASRRPAVGTPRDRDSFERRVAARVDELPRGQTVQVVVASNTFSLTCHKGTGGAGEVEVEGPGGLTLSWPTPDAGAPIYPGHWHRYRIGYSKDDGFFPKVIPWSMFRGRYVNAEWNNAGQTETSAPNDVPLLTTSLTRLPEPATLRSASGWSRCHGLSI